MTDLGRKEFLLMKNKGKSLLPSYLADLSNFFGRQINQSDLTNLLRTNKISNLRLDDKLESFKFEDELEFNKFMTRISIDKNINGTVFLDSSKYCGAFDIVLGNFLDSASKVKLITNQIIVFISSEERIKILLEYYEDKFEIEISDKYVS